MPEQGADTAAAAAVGKALKERTRKVAEVRAELAALRLSDLRKRAASGGVDTKLIDAAVDSEDAKGQLIALVVAGLPEQLAQVTDDDEGDTLMAELAALKLTALHKRALEDSADSAQIDTALDSDNPKQALISLLMDAARRTRTEAAGRAEKKKAALQTELQGCRVSVLQKRAQEGGVDATKLDEAMDSDNAKQELIKLILQLTLGEEDDQDCVATNAAATKNDQRVLAQLQKQKQAHAAKIEALRAELESIKQSSVLQKRALSEIGRAHV